MITERQKQLLGLVIENYIETMQPIGSRFLTESSDLDVSGATIRNELRALEEAGYLTHPHTSAGRVPTEQGYKFYVEEIMDELNLPAAIAAELQTLRHEDTEQQMKQQAKYIAERSGSAVILAFSADRVYYTGMSHLFAQPEFQDAARTVQISSVFDHCEERLPQMRQMLKDPLHILIGQQNPLGGACAALTSTLPGERLMIVLGPMRMRYKEISALLTHMQKHYE